MATARIVHALLIRGCPDPRDTASASHYSSVAPVVFTDGLLPVLPSELIGATILDYILEGRNGVSGYSWQTGFREPVGSGTIPSITVKDGDRQFPHGPCRVFAEDPGLSTTRVWTLDRLVVSSSANSIKLFGSVAPVVDQIIWIGQEAIQVDSISSSTDQSWTVIINRGVLGTRAIKHEIDPADYPDDGKSSYLYAYSRPDWDRGKLRCRYFEINSGTGAIVEFRDGFINQRPTSDRSVWKIQVEDISKLIASHKFGVNQEVQLSTCIEIIDYQREFNSERGISDVWPTLVRILLTRYESERFLRRVQRLPSVAEFDTALANSAIGVLEPSATRPDVTSLVSVQAGGTHIVFRIDNAQLASFPVQNNSGQSTAQDFVELICSLAYRTKGTGVNSEAVWDQDLNTDGPERVAGLNAGWSNLTADPIRSNEEPPKITLRVEVVNSPFKVAMYLLFSDGVSGVDPLNALPSRFGMNLDQTGWNIGTVATDPTTIAEDTTELKKLDQLFPQKRRYILDPSMDMKKWLTDVLLLHTALMAPFTGGLSFRVWSRFAPSTVTPLDYLVEGQDLQGSVGSRLGRLAAFTLFYEIDPVTLQPKRSTSIRLPDASAEDLSNAQQITVWDISEGGSTQTQQSVASAFRIQIAFFKQLQGSPSMLRYFKSSVDGVKHQVGDRVGVTDKRIPTPTGRGVTSLQCIVLSKDTNPEGGKEELILMADYQSSLSKTPGVKAPALQILSATKTVVSPEKWRLLVKGIGTASFDLTNLYQSIFEDIISASGYVRIRTPSLQNPFVAHSRRGWMEAYIKPKFYLFNGDYQLLDVESSGTMDDNARIEQIVTSQRAYLLLPDVNQDTLDGAVLPIAEALYNGGTGDDFIKISPRSGGVPFNNHYNTIGS